MHIQCIFILNHKRKSHGNQYAIPIIFNDIHIFSNIHSRPQVYHHTPLLDIQNSITTEFCLNINKKISGSGYWQ